MLSSKFFSLLTFAAAAVAQGFPDGPFFIANIQSELVLQAGNRSSGPDAFVVLAERDPDSYAQIWSYTEGRGFLTNEASRLVLEVPRTNGVVNYGTRLQEAVPRNETSDDLTQLWDYGDATQHLLTRASDTACLAGNDSLVYPVVDFCDSRDNDSQQWRFISVGNPIPGSSGFA